MLDKNSLIFVAGHRGLVGSSLIRRLKYFGYKKIITRSRKQLDLRDQKKVSDFFQKKKNCFSYKCCWQGRWYKCQQYL